MSTLLGQESDVEELSCIGNDIDEMYWEMIQLKPLMMRYFHAGAPFVILQIAVLAPGHKAARRRPLSSRITHAHHATTSTVNKLRSPTLPAALHIAAPLPGGQEPGQRLKPSPARCTKKYGLMQ